MKGEWVAGEGLRRIAEAPLPDQQRFLLAECVQAYLDLDAEQRREYEQLIAGEPFQGVRAMNKTWFEMGKEDERRRVLRAVLEERFGPLPPAAQQRIAEWPAERLEPLVRVAVKAQSLKEMGLED